MMRFANQDHESAKERALRIPLDYVHSLDRVQWWKLTICVIAALATGGYGAWVTSGNDGALAFSHGPVAHVHAVWDANCSACHLDYVAIRDDAANPLAHFGLVPPQKGLLADAQIHQRVNQKCQACHTRTPHNDNEIATDARTCASCHTDHRGRAADIARPIDGHCTRCHEDITSHRRNGQSKTKPAIDNVSQFSDRSNEASGKKPHPQFRSLVTDPGNVKFNHAMHMTAGIPARDPKAEGRTLMSLTDLPSEFVEQYRRSDQKPGAKPDSEYLVQLDCATCHRSEVSVDRLTATDSTKAPSSGAYMLPVSFEANCRACHHLLYDSANNNEMKHGLKPEEAREYLFGRYVFESKSGLLSESATRLIPARSIPGRSPRDNSKPGISGDIDEKVAAAERYLRDTNACAKCHILKTAAGPTTNFALPDVQPANIPQVWFKHARFDHAAHRAVSCAECHAQAFFPESSVGQPAGPTDQDVVMISGRDICLKCHSPRSQIGSTGGARYDCVECHRYHAADAPPQGIGADRREMPLPLRLKIDQFLQGSADSPRVQKQE